MIFYEFKSETFLELWSRENKGNSFSISSIYILSLPAHRERGETKSFLCMMRYFGEYTNNKSLGSVLGGKTSYLAGEYCMWLVM